MEFDRFMKRERVSGVSETKENGGKSPLVILKPKPEISVAQDEMQKKKEKKKYWAGLAMLLRN